MHQPSSRISSSSAVLGVWLVVASTLAGCGTPNASLPVAPRTVDAPNLSYKIGPLDALTITVWRNPELSGPVTVRPDGFISMALVGELRAAGRSPGELSQDIRAALSKVVLDPVVSVVVTGFQAVSGDQIRVVGEATRAGSLPYRPDMTLLDVMIHVGGLTKYANGNAAVLVRGSEGGKQYSIRLKDLLQHSDISANVAVLPGDVILVPESWY